MGAWFQGDVQGAAADAPSLLLLLGVTQRINLGVGLSDPLVGSSAEKAVVGIDQHGTDQGIWCDLADTATGDEHGQFFTRLRRQLAAYGWEL